MPKTEVPVGVPGVGTGGFQFKVSYNESPWPSRYGYRGICRRGAHLFNDKNEAKKFMARNSLREPELHEWKNGRWS